MGVEIEVDEVVGAGGGVYRGQSERGVSKLLINKVGE